MPDQNHTSSAEPATGVDLTLFVACYNEEGNIVPTLDTLTDALSEVGVSYEIIVIDDASADRSVERIREYIASRPESRIRLEENAENRGLAHNYVVGARLGVGRYYRMICGDNVEPKETFVAVFERLGEADMVIPYYLCIEGKPAYRVALSRLFVRLVNAFTGYRLRYYNAMAVHLRENVIRSARPNLGMEFQADLIVRLLDRGLSYVEVPVRGHERVSGTSTAVSAKNIARAGRFLAGLFLRRLRRVSADPEVPCRKEGSSRTK
jgi:glycosyltransferase involved in cell wall biosynthesis